MRQRVHLHPPHGRCVVRPAWALFMAPAADRVAAGMAALDEQRPGWWRDVDLVVLDVVTADNCPCGQVWGDWFQTPVDLRLGRVEYGFVGADTNDDARLNEAWREAIGKRLAALSGTGDDSV